MSQDSEYDDLPELEYTPEFLANNVFNIISGRREPALELVGPVNEDGSVTITTDGMRIKVMNNSNREIKVGESVTFEDIMGIPSTGKIEFTQTMPLMNVKNGLPALTEDQKKFKDAFEESCKESVEEEQNPRIIIPRRFDRTMYELTGKFMTHEEVRKLREMRQAVDEVPLSSSSLKNVIAETIAFNVTKRPVLERFGTACEVPLSYEPFTKL